MMGQFISTMTTVMMMILEEYLPIQIPPLPSESQQIPQPQNISSLWMTTNINPPRLLNNKLNCLNGNTSTHYQRFRHYPISQTTPSAPLSLLYTHKSTQVTSFLPPYQR
jgi:hypothetical protein